MMSPTPSSLLVGLTPGTVTYYDGAGLASAVAVRVTPGAVVQVQSQTTGNASWAGLSAPTQGAVAEPVWLFGHADLPATGMGIRSNGAIQFLGGAAFGSGNELQVGGPAAVNGMQRTGAQRIHMPTVLTAFDETFEHDGLIRTNATLTHRARTSTTDSTLLSVDVEEWADNTHALRRGRWRKLIADANGVREVIAGSTDGTQPLIGFLGAAAVPRQAVAADATDLATAIALVNDLKAKLQAFGLFN